MSHPPPSETLRVALVVLLLHLASGCTPEEGRPPPLPESTSASFSIRAGDVESLSPSGVSALAISYAEVSRIVIDVKEGDSGSVLFGNVDLALSDGVWSGTISLEVRRMELRTSSVLTATAAGFTKSLDQRMNRGRSASGSANISAMELMAMGSAKSVTTSHECREPGPEAIERHGREGPHDHLTPIRG